VLANAAASGQLARERGSGGGSAPVLSSRLAELLTRLLTAAGEQSGHGCGGSSSAFVAGSAAGLSSVVAAAGFVISVFSAGPQPASARGGDARY
jgi:hypothetical protein